MSEESHVVNKLRDAGREVKAKVEHAAHAIAHPLEHHEQHKAAEELERNLHTTTGAAVRHQTGPDVHLAPGPLHTTTVIEDRGSEYRPEAARSEGDMELWDVAGNGLAIVNTRAGIEEFFAANADRYLANEDTSAELGASIHALSLDAPPVAIGVGVSRFEPMPPSRRYNVINPLVKGLRLLGPQLAGLGATGIGEVAKAPSAIADTARQLHDVTVPLVDQGHNAKDLIAAGDQGRRTAEHVYLIKFSTTGLAPANEGMGRTETTSFPCTDKKGTHVVRIGDMKDAVLQLVDRCG